MRDRFPQESACNSIGRNACVAHHKPNHIGSPQRGITDRLDNKCKQTIRHLRGKRLARRRNVWVPPPSYHHSLEYSRDVDDDINSSKSPSTYIRTTLLLENIQILRISFSSTMWERPTANLAQRRSLPQRRRTRCKHFAQSFFSKSITTSASTRSRA